MATSSSQIGFASCYICASIIGVAFLLEGCVSGGDGGDLTPETCNFNMEEWRKEHEQCFKDIPEGDTCKGIEAQLEECFKGAPRRAFWLHHPRFDKFPCAHEKFDWTWAEEIIDSKFPAAKAQFQEDAEKCLKLPENQPAEDCSEQAAKDRHDRYDVCWKPAETGKAGGTWKEVINSTDNSVDITSDCPMHWFFQSIHKTRAPWVKWYRCECKHNETACKA